MMSVDTLRDTKISRLIEQALQEDIGFGDVTSESLIPEGMEGHASLLVKENGIISGLELVPIVFQYTDSTITTQLRSTDGSMISAGEIVAEIEGPARGILLGERVALNFLQRMSGIATLTHKYVHAVAGTGAKITDTRKTAPGLRMLDKKAVRDGGGVNHRFGLDQMVLIKDNHIVAAGSVTKAISQCKQFLIQQSLDVKIEVETTTLQQVEEVLRCGNVDRIMLDNFDIQSMVEAVRMIRHAIEVEASGGITLQTVKAVAETGVDFISVGALTHSPKALDISLEIHS
jgi:nicotinate-nucleotide pyrophosphorylase (carboxylating)